MKNMNAEVKTQDFLCEELSYKIIGCAYEVFNQIGPGHLEKIYLKALAKAFQAKNILYKEQIPYDVMFSGEKIGRGRFDFLVEEKVIVELKRGKFYFAKEINQVSEYLKTNNLKLGLIIRFTPDGVRVKRVVNIY
jgi:GxxExxY protein